MKKNIGIIILLVLAVVLVRILSIWENNKRSFHTLFPEDDLALAFSTALQYNNPYAYDMIDPSLKPRLDAWMNSHKAKKCIGEVDYSFISSGSNIGKKVKFGCFTETSYLSYEVDDIIIKDLKVIDWGEVREGD